MIKKIIFCFVVGIVTVSMYKLIKETKFLSERINTIDSQKNQLVNQVLFQSKLHVFDFNSESIVFNETNDPLKVSDILVGKKLILRFKDSDCNICVETELSRLKGLGDTFFKNVSIVLLVSYPSLRNVKVIKERYKIPFPIYNINSNDLASNLIEQINYPFLIFLNNGKTQSVFFPQKAFPELSKQYYGSIIQDVL